MLFVFRFFPPASTESLSTFLAHTKRLISGNGCHTFGFPLRLSLYLYPPLLPFQLTKPITLLILHTTRVTAAICLCHEFR